MAILVRTEKPLLIIYFVLETATLRYHTSVANTMDESQKNERERNVTDNCKMKADGERRVPIRKKKHSQNCVPKIFPEKYNH